MTASHTLVQALGVPVCGIEDYEIVQNYLHEPRDEFFKNFHDGTLEGG